MLIISIMQTVGIAVGTILLIVPGLILATMWIAAIPSYLDEEPVDMMGCFKRSAELTRGNRWRVFALIALASAFAIALSMMKLLLVSAFGGSKSLVGNLGTAVAGTIAVLVLQVGGASHGLSNLSALRWPNSSRLSRRARMPV